MYTECKWTGQMWYLKAAQIVIRSREGVNAVHTV